MIGRRRSSARDPHAICVENSLSRIYFKDLLSMCSIDPFFAYFSPETLLPVGSILATVAGVAMMLGRGSLRFLFRTVRRYARPSAWIAGVSRPHFRLGEKGEHKTARSESSTQSHDTTLADVD
jgi:hypothetical protein